MSLRAKRQGTIETPHSTITTKRERVTVGKRTMYITTFIREHSVTFYIGSKTIYCIDIHLYRSPESFQAIGELNKIRWDNQCSLDEEFEKGTDTSMILELAMTYLHDHYPMITHIRFTDMSTRKCDNGADVDLAAMKYFTDGKTWYEDRFHAVIDPRFETVYERMMNDADAVKTTMSWDRFASFSHLDKLPIAREQIEKRYHESRTWREFFSMIRDDIGRSAFCIWLSQKGWFDSFVRGALRFHLMSVTFLIDVSRFHIPYHLETNKSGGFRVEVTTTRRYKNRRVKNK